MKTWGSKLGLVLITMIFAGAAHAVKPVTDPLSALVKQDNDVSVLKFLKLDSDGKAEFKLVEDIYGKTDSSITLQIKDFAKAQLKEGKDYVVVHSEMIKHPMTRDEKIVDPEGPRVVQYFVVTQALFDATDDMVELFNKRVSGDLSNAREARLVMNELESANPLTRDFAGFQLYMNRKLLPELSAKDWEVIDSETSVGVTDDEISTFLLQIATVSPRGEQRERLLKKARAIVDHGDSEYELATFEPGLVKAAVIALGKVGDKSDTDRLKALLTSNAPGVAKSSIQAIARLNPIQARKIFTSALGGKNLHQETRRSLDQFMLTGEVN